MNAQTIAHDIVVYFPYVIAAAAAAAAALPKGRPGSKWALVRGVIDALAINFANAKNKDHDQ